MDSTSPFFTYRAQLDTVVDGDTLDLVLDCGFRIRHHARVRLVGVDTHEIYGVGNDSDEAIMGRAEAVFVEEWLQESRVAHDGEWPLIATTIRDRTGKYGRYLADVYRRDTRASLTDALRDEFPEVAD